MYVLYYNFNTTIIYKKNVLEIYLMYRNIFDIFDWQDKRNKYLKKKKVWEKHMEKIYIYLVWSQIKIKRIMKAQTNVPQL